jgi:(1->4)-alpha-D-glucan 1-alpha-D-glucosylmutase
VAGRWLAFVMRWQQFTSPVMAKGVEDTALYRYVPLVARDEVGSDPGGRPTPVSEFHTRMAERAARWPHALSTTSTHDTKRSEDVRARLDVLSELPDRWTETALRWQRWNRPFKREVRGELAPDPTEELLLYQTLVGMWPLRRAEERSVAERARAFMAKAIREGKVHTSWIEPDPAWEAAVDGFVADVLAPRNRRFRSDLLRLAETLAWFGMLNGLAQVLLKVAAPGVPDLYQGTETWNLRLVDPDNRSRPDFDRLAKARRSVRDVADPAPLWSSWRDGRIKLLVTARALEARRRYEGLFANGKYLGLVASGQRRDHVVGFARGNGSRMAVAITPRLCTSLAAANVPPIGAVWGRATIALPVAAPDRWHDAIAGHEVTTRHRAGAPVLRVAEALSTLPVALLVSDR